VQPSLSVNPVSVFAQVSNSRTLLVMRARSMEWVIAVRLVLLTNRMLVMMLQRSLGGPDHLALHEISGSLCSPYMRELGRPDFVKREGAHLATCTDLLT